MVNKSRAYLRNLTIEERKKLASKISPSSKSFHQYLYQIGVNWRGRTPSRDLAAKLQKATNGKIKATDFEREALNKIVTVHEQKVSQAK